MAHKRHGRRALGWTDALPFIIGAIILVAVPPCSPHIPPW